MASIEERAGNHRVRWRKGGRHGSPESCTFQSSALAERAKKLAEAHGHDITGQDVEAIINGEPTKAEIASEAPTVRAWSDIWLASRTRIGADQRRRYRSQLDRIVLPAIGDLPIDVIDGGRIVDLLEGLRGQDYKSTTRTRYFSLLSSLFGYAVREKKIPDNPCARTDFVRDLIDDDDEGDIHDGHVYLTRAEYQMVFDHMAPFGRPIIEFLVGVGARWSEATGVKMETLTLDPSRGKPSVCIRRAWKRNEKKEWELGPTKNRTRRDVSLGLRTVNAIRGLTVDGDGHARGPGELLLTAPGGGRLMHANFRNRYWEPAVAAAMRCPDHMPPLPAKGAVGPARKLRPWEVSTCDCPTRLHQRPTLHDLRHTYVAWLIDKGVRMKAISEMIGHRTTEVTETVYAGLLPHLRESVADAIDSVFSE